MTKLINSNYERKKLKLFQNLKTKIVTKLKKLELYQNSKNWIGTKWNIKFDKFEKLNLWQSLTIQIETKLKNLNYNQNKNFWQKSFVKNKWTPRQPMICIWGSHLQSRNVLTKQVCVTETSYCETKTFQDRKNSSTKS